MAIPDIVLDNNVMISAQRSSSGASARMSLRIPKSMYGDLKEIAEVEGISMNQFVMIAVAEKIAALNTMGYLERRANRGSREK